ncbi:MAG TPA: protein kinase [Pirellulales bacterium]|nr:protein kinase [Pirellulales bacterium]
MNFQAQPCRTDLIEQFLDDRLDTDRVAALERHLDSCPDCRRELELRAADESWWSRVRDCLATGDSGPSSGGSESDATPAWPEPGPKSEVRTSLAAIKPYLAPTDDPQMMGRVGPYEVLGVVGSGGNGVVLKGFDAALNRYVAIKLLSPQLGDSAAARRRFSREAQAAAAVVHDNVMAIHAVSDTQGLPYLVMPYVRGPSLEKRLRGAGPLALEEILRVGMQVAAGLAAAHAQGLVHRDIKPANILLEEGVERVKITDFGLARAADDASLTRSGMIAGTPQYMSPEQARGEPIDHRADLFSLGCVLYAACTGRPPFRAPTSYGVLRKICESEPRPLRDINPSVPVWLARVVDRLLAKEPSRRYASAADVAALLERCLAHVQQPATVGLPTELADPPRHRYVGFLRQVSRRGALVAALGMLLLAAALATRRKDPAQEEAQPDDKKVAVAPSREPEVKSPAAWDDGVVESMNDLGAEIDRLRSDCLADLPAQSPDDSLTERIEQLKCDLDDLETRINLSLP